MGTLIDITGKKYERYTVIEKVRKGNRWVWKCQCDCGNIGYARSSDLRKGRTKSCGCYQKERCSAINRNYGMSHTRIYRVWWKMRDRCQNPKHNAYKDYGGRGIKVCKEWENNFEVFYKWAMENGYTDELTIDRIDVNGNYEPSNCRFITMQEQMNNKRNNHYLIYKGEKHTITEWARIKNMSVAGLKYRMNNQKMSVEDALEKPLMKKTTRIKKKGEKDG